MRRAGYRADLSVSLREAERLADRHWMHLVDEMVDGMLQSAAPVGSGRWFGPEDKLPRTAESLIELTLQHARTIDFQDFRYLVEVALPRAARRGDVERALALRVLTELRKRLTFSDLGNKALSSLEYMVDGGHTDATRLAGRHKIGAVHPGVGLAD